MTADVLKAALVIARERVRRSVIGAIGALWLAGTLVIVAMIVPLSVSHEGKLAKVYRGKWLAFQEEILAPEGLPESPPAELEGLIRWPPPDLETRLAESIAAMIANWVLCWGGMAFVVMVTCDYFTGAVERGRVELLLARPVPRSVVLLAHYFAGLGFVTALFAPLVLLTFVAIWLRAGHAPVGYLLTIPILVGMYAVLHAIQTLAAATWRNWFLALIIPIVIWGFCFGVEKVRGGVKAAVKGIEEANKIAEEHGGPSAVQKLQAAPMQAAFVQAELPLDVAYHVFPKPSEFDNLNLLAIHGTEHVRREVGEDYSPWTTILSSAAWAVGALALACLLFHFREF